MKNQGDIDDGKYPRMRQSGLREHLKPKNLF